MEVGEALKGAEQALTGRRPVGREELSQGE
jgi:hypothetical protein